MLMTIAAYAKFGRRGCDDREQSTPRALPISLDVGAPQLADKNELLHFSRQLRKIQLSDNPTTVEALHYWRLLYAADVVLSKMGKEYQVIDFSPSSDALRTGWSATKIRNAVLTESEYMSTFDTRGQRLIVPCEGGLSVAQIRGAKRGNGQSHPGQLLFYLSETNVGLDETVKLSEGSFRVRDILNREMKFFDKSVPADYLGSAFVRYILPSKSIVRWDGSKVSFDEILELLVKDVSTVGWCYGTHRCYAIAAILKIDSEHRCLSPASRIRGMEYLKTAAAQLSLSQHSDGAWRYDWAVGGATNPDFASNEWGEAILVTGHHLEWQLLLDDDSIEPMSSNIDRAREYLERQMTAATPRDVSSNFLAWCHAARSLLLWRCRRPNTYSQIR